MSFTIIVRCQHARPITDNRIIFHSVSAYVKISDLVERLKCVPCFSSRSRDVWYVRRLRAVGYIGRRTYRRRL